MITEKQKLSLYTYGKQAVDKRATFGKSLSNVAVYLPKEEQCKGNTKKIYQESLPFVR